MTSEQGGRSSHQNNRAGQSAGGVRRRDEAGRERNRSTTRNKTETAPGQRTRVADPARLVAFEVLRAVSADDAYANLVLPTRIRRHGLDRRDAGFATELTYGALRAQGTYDAILATCVDRPLSELDPAVLDALRIGVHQLMAMRVPQIEQIKFLPPAILRTCSCSQNPRSRRRSQPGPLSTRICMSQPTSA